MPLALASSGARANPVLCTKCVCPMPAPTTLLRESGHESTDAFLLDEVADALASIRLENAELARYRRQSAALVATITRSLDMPAQHAAAPRSASSSSGKRGRDVGDDQPLMLRPHKQASEEEEHSEECDARGKTLDELLAMLASERAKRETNRRLIEENAAEIEKLQRRHAELAEQLRAEQLRARERRDAEREEERGHSGRVVREVALR